MSWLRRAWISAGIGAIPLVSVGCFTALAIYSGNSAEFSMSLLNLLQFYLPYFLVVVGISGAVGAMLSGAALQRYHAVLAGIGVLVWLQGNILVWDYGVLDGRSINWLSDAWRGVLDLTLWVAVLGIAAFAYKRYGRLLLTAAVVTVAIQLVNAAVILGGPFDPGAGRVNAEKSDAGRSAMARFSTQQNVLHIVMDGFQTDIFEALVSDPAHQVAAADLRGFTLFRNNVGLYPYTQLTIPAMLSGREYRNHVPVTDFIASAMSGETILAAAYNEGFEVDVATQISLLNSYTQAPHTHAYATASNAHVTRVDYIRNDAARLLDLALFRSVPHFAKALVHRDELWVFQALTHSDAYLHMKYFSDLRFLEELADSMTVDRDVPVYKLLHVMLSHQPTVGSATCEYDGRHDTNRQTVTHQARCGLWRVVDVLRRMQALGIYDDSLIVLMADHGAWVPLEDPDSFAGSDVDPLIAAMSLPVLAIKPPQANHDFMVSAAPTAITDLPATVAELLGLSGNFTGVPAFALAPDMERKRRHLIYGYGINPESEGYLFPMQAFEILGSPYNGAAWRKAELYRPGAVVEPVE